MALYAQHMTAGAEPLQKLAECVEQRIGELALEYTEVAELAGFSVEVLRKIRNGVKVRANTYRKLERALLWARGSVDAILAGGKPAPIDDARDAGLPPASEAPGSLDDARDEATAAAIRSILAGLDPESRERVMSRLLVGLDPESRDRLLRLLGFTPPRSLGEPGEPEGKRRAG